MDVAAKEAGAACDRSSSSSSSASSHYLRNSSVAIYNADKRHRHDTAWTVGYCVLAALTLFWGIAAIAHKDPNAGLYTSGFYYNSTSCDITQYRKVNPLPDDEYEDADPTFVRAFGKSISVWLPVTAIVAICTSCVYLLLFRGYAKAMVRLTIYASVGLGLLFSIVCFAVGAAPFGIILLIITVITALVYWWIRDQLRMCAELLALAGRGLNENLGLVPAAIGIKVAGMCVLVYSFWAFYSAVNIGSTRRYAGGNMQPNAIAEKATCYDAVGNNVPCCEFVTKGWASAYAFFAAVFMSWTTMLIMQVKLYAVADTMAQWYFSAPAPGTWSAAVGAATQSRVSVKLALRHCLTTSFGSIAFAAAILALLRMLRRMLERAARNNVICCIINCFAQPLLAMAEKFTRFATIATAITGEAFVPAAKSVFDTLKRNFLQTYSMWWVPDAVLQTTVFLFSLTWGAVVFFSTYGANKSNDAVWGIAFATAAVAFVLMLYTLMFVAGLLLDAVNTLYICYAMDKDQRRVTHPEIHAIYMQVPGLAVENPDGAVMYGAPEPQAMHPAPLYSGAYPSAAPTPAAAPYGAPYAPTVAPYAPTVAYTTPYPAPYPSYPPPAAPTAAYPVMAPVGGYTYVQTSNPTDRV